MTDSCRYDVKNTSNWNEKIVNLPVDEVEAQNDLSDQRGQSQRRNTRSYEKFLNILVSAGQPIEKLCNNRKVLSIYERMLIKMNRIFIPNSIRN